MTQRSRFIVLLLILLAGAGVWLALTRVNLSALPEPGRVETYLASKGKQWLIGRSARGPLPPKPPSDSMSLMRGQMNYGARCAACHGLDGRTPTDFGRATYPRTPDLGSPAVQAYSDAELFWIIKNGIRLTGMPGFGRIHSDEEIWHLVHYVRSLRPPPPR